MDAKKTWANCILAILVLQIIIASGFIGLYFGVKKLGINQEALPVLLLVLIIGFVIFSCYAIFAAKESLNKFYEYQKEYEDKKKEEFKLSQRLLELISKESAIRKSCSNVSSDENELRLSVECSLSIEN